jgi:hypothetical protein
MGTHQHAGPLPVITETALERKLLAGFRALDLDGQACALAAVQAAASGRVDEAQVRKLAAGGTDAQAVAA